MQLYVLTLCIQAPRYPVACSDAASSRDRTVWIAGVTLTHAVAGRQVVSAGRTVTGPGTTGRTATDRVPSAPRTATNAPHLSVCRIQRQVHANECVRSALRSMIDSQDTYAR